MDNISTTELRELINDAMSVVNEKVEAKYNIIDCKLDLIGQRLDKLNGKVAKHEQSLNEHTVVIADYINHAKKSDENEKRIRTLEDAQLSNASIKKWIVGTVGITGALIGIAYTLLQMVVK